jgi:hypothetical protein
MVETRLSLDVTAPFGPGMQSRDLTKRKSRGKKCCAHATRSLLPITAAQSAQDSEVRK